MMRRLISALVFLTAAGFVAPALAQSQDGSGRARAVVGAVDQEFYFSVARSQVLNAGADVDLPWSRDGRSGTIRFGVGQLQQNATYECRDFFVRETRPAARPPIVGLVCVTEPGVAPTSGEPSAPPTPLARVDERHTRYDLRRIDYAVAAGPGGEGVVRPPPSPSRGITVPARPVQRPSPPPAPVPEPPPPPAPGQPRSTQITIKPVLVQINRQTARENQNGGHAVVLLRDTPAVRARNLATCEAMLRHFDDAPISEVRVGVRREADGSISALRPIYWPVNERVTVVGDRCAQRLQRYDFTRAATIRDKLRIAGDGPYLVVSRSDERLAATIDLSGMSSGDVEKAVVYFRDGMSQRGNVWDPQSFTRQRQEQSLIASFGVNFPRVLLAAVRFYAPLSGANAAQTPPPCLGDLTDTRRC